LSARLFDDKPQPSARIHQTSSAPDRSIGPRALKGCKQRHAEEGNPSIAIGIGIGLASSEVIAGSSGTQHRAPYT
jgi:hypothetical protein